MTEKVDSIVSYMNTGKKRALEIFESIDFEKIIEHPNILVSANFWEPERYQAARVCYRVMRQIDDLIDNHKAEHKAIAPHEKEQFVEDVEKWLKLFLSAGRHDPAHAALVETIERFRIPLWPLEDFARAMIYDINHDGFDTLQTYLDYSRGASVAPASIFVHLSGLRSNGNGYQLPLFDVRDTATPCAIFSYLVHIMRDFQKDHHNNLNYFAGDMMAKHGLTVAGLRKMAFGEPLSDGFRNMMAEYMALADRYRSETIQVMERVCPLLESPYRLSLEIIFNLYLMVFERIDPMNGSFTTAELVPTPADTKARVRHVIEAFPFD
ncbi:MAG: squalene/phytoene synthase family protein [Bacteroidales bacterium]|nr:squalene/phytoene synthase family protein [Bacteroidales bacterium]